ncbi:MAG TPA: lysylphosphatidylglycerol synthase transmembrane domain-containing protein, partial [Cyclobacteriaceae bacterium]|nr:lysylphosphatidylglycerol synthase transmembrane domain-containing protein [Cyclobacteriaceae bacterium]
YLFIFGLTALLIWFSLSTLHVKEGENKWQYLYHTWQAADKGWLLAMAGIFMLGQAIRAERWRMLMEPTGYKATFYHSFLATLIGYLVNLVIPRGGEVSRCYYLYKLNKSPVEISFGTVVIERIIDLLCLVILVALSFAVESEKLFAFISTLPIQANGLSGKLLIVAVVLIFLLVAGFFVSWYAKRNQKLGDFLQRTWLGFKQGLAAIFKLERKFLFIGYSVAIWTLYFLMSYCVVMAFKETSVLGITAVLSLFAIGAIAMAAPLPGGAGSYHTLVPAGLVFLYAIPQSDAVAFTFVFHAWQTLIMIVSGAIALVVTSWIVKKKSVAG